MPKPLPLNRLRRLSLLAGMAALLPSAALGHAGEHGMSSFMEGLTHPLAGIDHLAAMLAVGLWGALSEPRWPQAARAPLAFALALLLGAGVAMATGWVPALIEPGIAVSLLGLGLLVAWRVPLPQPVGLGLVVLFAWMHGAAHGLELHGALALLGMVVTTVLLHGVGIAFGLLLRPTAMRWSEGVGATLMTFGALRLAGVL